MKKKEIKNVLYIHGFNSGPEKKAAIIKQNGFECFCPQLINQPKKDIETLKDCIKNNNIHHIVGTSLGGYYGSILSIEFKDLQYHSKLCKPLLNFNLVIPSFINNKNLINELFPELFGPVKIVKGRS